MSVVSTTKANISRQKSDNENTHWRTNVNQFAGKTAIISGGGEGIGLSIAKALGKEKMNIVLADIDETNLQTAAKEMKKLGIPTLTVVLDVAEESQWYEVAKKTVERFGKIHMVVNNAGVIGETGPIEKQKADAWHWSLNVNLMGVVYGVKTMVPRFKEHGEGGWIINVASMAGMGGAPYGGAYTATKMAVVGLSEGWAAELKKDAINVSVLCPAFVQTRIHESDRNRPASLQSQPAEASNDGRQNKSKKSVENGIEVSVIGERVVEALKLKEFYIFTHPNYRSVIQGRSKSIDEAFERAAKSPLLQHIVNQPLDML
jgi:NAD(P)-dependent dehydrogenase (short-subunit alcohol dehydrogenase family)